MNSTTETTKGKLSEKVLYLGDNGRCFCGKSRCAGATAYFSGRDLSGQRVLPITPALARQNGFTCEGCGYSG